MPVTRKRQADIDNGIVLEEGPYKKMRVNGVNKKKDKARADASEPPFIFPNSTQPVASECPYLPPLSDDNVSVFPDNVGPQLIHRRLHRLKAKCPTISLFPWLITAYKKPGRKSKWTRANLRKGLDERWCFTASSMFRFEKMPTQTCRLGLFLIPSKKGKTSHAWAAAIVDKQPIGKYLVIYDCDMEIIKWNKGRKHLTMSNLDAAQIGFISSIKATRTKKMARVRIDSVYCGGKAKYDNKNRNKCLENTLAWMETLTDISVLHPDNLLANGFEDILPNLNPSIRAKQKARREEKARAKRLASANKPKSPTGKPEEEEVDDGSDYSYDYDQYTDDEEAADTEVIDDADTSSATTVEDLGDKDYDPAVDR